MRVPIGMHSTEAASCKGDVPERLNGGVEPLVVAFV